MAAVFVAGCMASSVSSRFSLIPELPRVPHQPPYSFSFPKQLFGSKKVVMISFQASWFKQWSFLNYDEVKDVAYDATIVRRHEQSLSHRQAVEMIVTIPS